MNRIIFVFFVVSFAVLSFGQNGKFSINGTVSDSVTGIPISNCNVFLSDKTAGASTSIDGTFTLLLNGGNQNLVISHVGYRKQRLSINVSKNISLNIKLQPLVFQEDEVTVLGNRSKSEIEVQEMKIKEIENMPNIYGDILRSVQILSGVSTNNELSSGYNVRGGSYNDNLIYLNGYEIYRPFLLKNGVEENQSIVNPDMVETIDFYNGAFPARYGDKLSSSLDVKYKRNAGERFEGSVRLDMLNAGINLRKKVSFADFNFAARYAYPSNFLGGLQTKGDYNPSFSDFQLLTTFNLNETSKIELFTLYAVNKFEMDPNNWEGHFGGFVRGDYQGVAIDYDGYRNYNYYTGLAGLKFKSILGDNLLLTNSVSRYWTKEKDNEDLTGEVFYLPNPESSEGDRIYLKSRNQFADNEVELDSYRFQSELEYQVSNHSVIAGAEYRFVNLSNFVNENFFESGDSVLIQTPLSRKIDRSYELNSLSIYAEDNIKLSDKFGLSAGLRFHRYEFTNENLVSPRVSLMFYPNSFNTLKLSYGIYYQPPFQNELSTAEVDGLKSQKSTHYVLGWESRLNANLSITAEAYYKDLNNIIPFYFDGLQMVYSGSNEREGYAYGLDVMVRGEIVEGTKSWVGYSYLDSGEKEKGSTSQFQRRLLDQTHTLQIFLQDKMPKHPNWQSHLRFLFGSGFLYYNRVIRDDPTATTDFIEVQMDNPNEYFLFLRVDMGLSAKFNIADKQDLIVVGEVLNVFNHLNIASYEFIQVWRDVRYPMRVPQVLSRRFFNLRLEYRF